jgi:hypothetical protein
MRYLGLAAALFAAFLARPALGETIQVPPGASLQAAVDAAASGDVLELAEGRYDGDVDFGGKAVVVRGVGPETLLRGSGDGPVVRFTSGEDENSVLDSVTVRGGVADQGGGVLIVASSPRIVRCVVRRNRARSSGSGIYVGGGSRALIYNNLVIHNRRLGAGDPHGIEIVNAAPLVVNNTIARTDSNGLILRGNSAAVVANNIFAYNGARVRGKLRGRGICDFSGGRATISGNVFHRNRIAALLRGGQDWKRIERFQAMAPDPLVTGNSDASPGFLRRPGRLARRARARHFALRRNARARDAGLADPLCNDADGTRNDAGHTGGPYAAGVALPDHDDCGSRGPGTGEDSLQVSLEARPPMLLGGSPETGRSGVRARPLGVVGRLRPGGGLHGSRGSTNQSRLLALPEPSMRPRPRRPSFRSSNS